MAKNQDGDADLYSASEFNCPNCGERVYHELLVCPKCGLHFFPQDEEEEEAPRIGINRAGDRSAFRAFSIPILLTGWAVSAIIAFLYHWVAVQIWSPETISSTGLVVVALGAPLGAFTGGYLAAWNSKAPARAAVYGLAVGLLSLLHTLIMETYWQNLANQPLTAGAVLRLVIVPVFGLFGGLLWMGTTRKPGKTQFYP